jgi:hypothetical protein
MGLSHSLRVFGLIADVRGRLLRARLCIENFRSRREAETGSMTGWWVSSSSPSVSTIQSPQTARFRHDVK